MGYLVKGKYCCPKHGEILWADYLIDEEPTLIIYNKKLNAKGIKKENGKYKVTISCPNCPQTTIKYYSQNEVTIEKF
ncbi:MAG: hypothetical protein HFH31_01785 [Bacilli bacterium]|nr:hypothetical protein [Bacilli bacterium]